MEKTTVGPFPQPVEECRTTPTFSFEGRVGTDYSTLPDDKNVTTNHQLQTFKKKERSDGKGPGDRHSLEQNPEKSERK